MIEEDLTRGEKLFLQRRRDRFSKYEQARILGVTYQIYVLWEEDRRHPPDTTIHGLTQLEQFVVLRRRAGMTQSSLAQRIGTSRQYLSAMENGHIRPSHLVRFWENYR